MVSTVNDHWKGNEKCLGTSQANAPPPDQKRARKSAVFTWIPPKHPAEAGGARVCVQNQHSISTFQRFSELFDSPGVFGMRPSALSGQRSARCFADLSLEVPKTSTS